MKKILKLAVVKILNFEASIILKRHQPKIVAITGSVGKTSTKDAIYSAIKSSVYARKSEKSFNSEIGLPLTILGLPNVWSNPFRWFKNIIDGFFICIFTKSYPEVLVLELGVGEKGDMANYTKLIQPDIVVLTRLPEIPVHVEYFSTPQEVIEEKMQIVSSLKPEGVLIYNNDDVIIKKQLKEVLNRRVGFGRYLETDFTARNDSIVYSDDRPVGVRFNVIHMGTDNNLIINDTVGTQHVYSCIAAIAVADELSIPVKIAVESLNTLQTPPGRMRIVKGIKSTTIIDDTYNSSPIACEQALQALNEVKYQQRKIAVLGDMLELGKYSSDEHQRIGSLVAEVADVLLTVGVRARQIAEGALSAGMSEKNIFQYDDVNRAGTELQTMLKPSDIILIKASQPIRAEKIIEEIMAEPEKAQNLLVRQDEDWKKR